MSKHKKYLVLSHPRSGSGYMSHLFKTAGYDVGHERVGKHGISSWMLATYAPPPWTFDYAERGDYKFDTIIQVIREPIAAVASIALTESASLYFRSKYVLIYGNLYERAVMSYIGWNKLIQAQQPHYTWRLENSHVQLGKLLRKQIAPIPPQNTRAHDPLTLADLRDSLNPSLFEQFERFLGEYYAIPIR